MTIGSSSAEADVQKIGPLKPAAMRQGSRPTWSMWTWVTTSAHTPASENPISSRPAPADPSAEVSAPWNSPQSTSTDAPPGRCSWWHEPVTPFTAPWWVKCKRISGTMSHPSSGPDDTHCGQPMHFGQVRLSL